MKEPAQEEIVRHKGEDISISASEEIKQNDEIEEEQEEKMEEEEEREVEVSENDVSNVRGTEEDESDNEENSEHQDSMHLVSLPNNLSTSPFLLSVPLTLLLL